MATKEELEQHRTMWTLQLNDPTFSDPIARRKDYKAAVSLKNHLYRQSEDYQKPIPPLCQDRRRRGCQFSETHRPGPKLIHRLHGHSCQVRRLLHSGGRVTTGMDGTITTLKTWSRIWARCEELHIVRYPNILWSNIT